ncbi:MAG TPA: amidohydrolase family protein [Miltoncostaeaceae bacterium]|nr:amidohydrolase family protein [Miltoncostaeaceae bacterium]
MTTQVATAVDVHQHLWPDPLLRALHRRARTPLIRRSGQGWVLRIDGEPEWPIDLRDHDPVRRAALVADDGLDEAWVALSSPLGVEALPPDESAELIAAQHEGTRGLPAGLRAWASTGVASPDPRALGAALDEGFVGLVLPAGALSGPGGIDVCAPLLRLLEERSAPLLVHPGPAPWAPPSPAGAGLPDWWPAMTSYVAQMQTAWLAVRTWARPAFPRLRVCFAMLAGLAPLQAERLAARGGGAGGLRDPLTFYDTSSYGPAAIAAMAAAVGADALVHGSDRPVVDPESDAETPARARNAARLLAPQEATR